MPRPTIKSLEADLHNAKENAYSYQQRNKYIEKELADLKTHLAALDRDKQWLKQLCQEQSSSIADYMRSR